MCAGHKFPGVEVAGRARKRTNALRGQQSGLDDGGNAAGDLVLHREHVAELAIGERDGAWRWRFDPGIARRFSDNLIAEHLRRVVCPLELIYGERSSLVSANTVTAISTLTGRPIRGTALPDGYHHVILDQPELTKDAMIAAFTRMAGDQ